MIFNPQSSFSASYDKTTKIISAVIVAGLLVLLVATKSIVVSRVAAVLVLLAYACSPGDTRSLNIPSSSTG